MNTGYSFQKYIKDKIDLNLDAKVSLTATAASIAALNNVSSADVNAACDTAITDAALATAASIAALNNVSSADVNAACDTAITDAALATAASIAALNNVSSADVNAACDTAITDAALATAAGLTSLESNIRGGSETLESLMTAIALIDAAAAKTTFGVIANTAQALTADTWSDIYSSGALAKDTKYAGIQISTTATDSPKYRLVIDGSHAFPFDVLGEVVPTDLAEFDESVVVPSGSTMKVQVKTTESDKTATLDELDVITLG